MILAYKKSLFLSVYLSVCAFSLGRPLGWHFIEFILFSSNSWENFTFVSWLTLPYLLKKMSEKNRFQMTISHSFKCVQPGCWLISSTFDKIWLRLKNVFFCDFVFQVWQYYTWNKIKIYSGNSNPYSRVQIYILTHTDICSLFYPESICIREGIPEGLI